VELVERPQVARVFVARRRVRLADADASGRLRLDAVARYLQDVASDDVEDAGWASREHVWVVRRTVVDVVVPIGVDESVELATWCSGTGASVAARRTSIAGDGGGRIEAESIWVQLGPDLQPARLGERFHATYAAASAGRRASPRFELDGVPPDGVGRRWPLRATDVDVLGHVNNAAYFVPVEEALLDAPGLAARARRAVLEYRRPIDLGEDVDVRVALGDELRLWFVVADALKAAAAVRSL
jgi:acyl-ACP thioesterase